MSGKYTDMRPLFSGANDQGEYTDARSDLLVSKILRLANFDAGFQTSEIESIYQAGNYANNSGMRDQDVHPEFKNFVKDLGKYHAAIDKALRRSFNSEDVDRVRQRRGTPEQVEDDGRQQTTNADSSNNASSSVQASALHEFLNNNWATLEPAKRNLYSFAMNMVDNEGRAIELGTYFNGTPNPTTHRFNLKTVDGSRNYAVYTTDKVRFTRVIPPALLADYLEGL